MNSIQKRIASIILAVCTIFCTGSYALAGSYKPIYTFVYSDGSTVDYQLDNNGKAYIVKNGEKLFLLGVNSEVVTDIKILNILNSESDDKLFNAGTRANPPASYYELSAVSYDSNSREYNQTVYPTSGTWTQFLRYYSQHDTIRFKGENPSGGLPLRRVSVQVYTYDEIDMTWSCNTYTIPYTGIHAYGNSAGIGFSINCSIIRYGRFYISSYDSVSQFDLSIWSTYCG